jgi:FixJ family two-component response regulator
VLHKLTEKERQIVDSVGPGRTNHEVADERELSHKTVEWTLTRTRTNAVPREEVEPDEASSKS